MAYTIFLKAGYESSGKSLQAIRLNAWITDSGGEQFGMKISEITGDLATYLNINSEYGMPGAVVGQYAKFIFVLDYLFDNEADRVIFLDGINNYKLNITLTNSENSLYRLTRADIPLSKTGGLVVAGFPIEPSGAPTSYAPISGVSEPTPFFLREAEDETPSNPITDFQGVGSDGFVNLTWKNPTDVRFHGVWLVKKEKSVGEITGPFDNEATAVTLFNNNNLFKGESHTDTEVVNEVGYYYHIWPFTKFTKFEESTDSIEVTPQDEIVGTPENFRAVSAHEKVILFWDPVDDAEGYLLVRQEGFEPTFVPQRGQVYTAGSNGVVFSSEDGDIPTEGDTKKYTDESLVNDITYYYALYAYDDVKNYFDHANNNNSEGDRVNGTPVGAPRVIKAVSSSKTTLYIVFNQDMDRESILNIANYQFFEDDTESSLRVLAARFTIESKYHPQNVSVTPGERSVELVTTKQTAGVVYTIKLNPTT